jgi:hypothetical protein
MSTLLSSMLVVLLLVALLLNPAQGFGGISMTISSGNLQSSALVSPSLERDNLFAVRTQSHEREKKEWINRSVNYYTKVMREERRRTMGQIDALQEAKPDYRDEFLILAKKHYFARYKIKNGRPQHAEQIYLRIIDELSQEEDGHCDHAKMAVTTLLLALLRQRMGDSKGTRSTFLNFFRIAFLDMDEDTECACSAKVLQAYALFEMKQGNSLKSLDLATKAIKLDDSLKPILQWKQFRDALERVSANKLARA